MQKLRELVRAGCHADETKAEPPPNPAPPLREALQKIARMNLAGFVIPVSASVTRPAARREFVLALASRHQRGEAFVAGVASAMLLMPP